MATVGERIKSRREELGWKQDDLASKAGISKSFLSDLENGKRNVGADKLLDIARALNLSLD
ncbi:helix-turn-helix transcriptional regulator, partial [bacterium]|nr:helix-turn-helix transcriptional regulator [bacterium]